MCVYVYIYIVNQGQMVHIGNHHCMKGTQGWGLFSKRSIIISLFWLDVFEHVLPIPLFWIMVPVDSTNVSERFKPRNYQCFKALENRISRNSGGKSPFLTINLQFLRSVPSIMVPIFGQQFQNVSGAASQQVGLSQGRPDVLKSLLRAGFQLASPTYNIL